MKAKLLAFVDDIFLVPRIQDIAHQAGYEITFAGRPEHLDIHAPAVRRPIPLTEPLEGAEAELVSQISAMQPALILVDVLVEGLPWAHWIQVLKTSAATRRIPILVFGPHVETHRLEEAAAQGADMVITRGTFHKQMFDLIRKHAQPNRKTRLLEACERPLPKMVIEGIRLHNEHDYFEAHELLERAWQDATEEEGFLYRALLQLTVAYLHLSRDNPRGARKMLLRIHQWLDPLPANCQGVDVAALQLEVQRLRDVLISGESVEDLHPIQIQLVS